MGGNPTVDAARLSFVMSRRLHYLAFERDRRDKRNIGMWNAAETIMKSVNIECSWLSARLDVYYLLYLLGRDGSLRMNQR